ncbi:hypothetical protein ACFU9F_02200 [Streptomyces zhihengii]|uniref:Rv1733c family protein n=1 Tax=Streptomyces zhihengii TaxID=1818004 RepID=UPI003678CEA4
MTLEAPMATDGPRHVPAGPLVRPLDITRKRVDRALLVVLLVGLPLVTVIVGVWAHSGFDHNRQEQVRDRRPVAARLLEDPHAVADSGGANRDARATVRWRDAGAVRTATAEVSMDKRAGDRATVYVDEADGNIVKPPMDAYDVAASTVAAAVLAPSGFVLVWGLTRAAVRWALDRRCWAAWEREWAAVEPVWTRHR